jgi:hypothetical protein
VFSRWQTGAGVRRSALVGASFAAALFPAAALFFTAAFFAIADTEAAFLVAASIVETIFLTAFLAAAFFDRSSSRPPSWWCSSSPERLLESPSAPRSRHQIFRRDIRREPHRIRGAGVRHYRRAHG